MLKTIFIYMKFLKMSAAGGCHVVLLKRDILRVKAQYFLQRRESSGADTNLSGSLVGWSK